VELEDVFRTYQRPVFAYFLRVVGSRPDAEELSQETFLRACSAALRFRGGSSVKTWIFGIARNVLMEASRAGLFERTHELVDTPAAPDDPAQRVDLERAFARIGVADREVLMLVDVLGFEPSEAAAMIGIKQEAMRVRLHRARGRMREAIGR
jgi:RNA polymerase sigma-70 factor (ECF subfamily)